MTGDCSSDGELRIVYGNMGSGRTTVGLSFAEQADEVITNLHSVGYASYGSCSAKIRDIVNENPNTVYGILLDDISRLDISDELLADFVADMVELGHTVVLTGHKKSEFPDEILREHEYCLFEVIEAGVTEFQYQTEYGLECVQVPVSEPDRVFAASEQPNFTYIECHGDEMCGFGEPCSACREDALEDVSGVTPRIARRLYRAGYTSVDDLRGASKNEIASAVALGRFNSSYALGVRIKADVGDAEQDEGDDLTQVSGVDDEEAELLNAAGFETLDDLREATQHELANIRIGNALAARIKADVGGAEASFKDFFGISQEEADAFREAGLEAISDSSEETQDVHGVLAINPDEDELDEMFQPDEKFPPQFHLDYLERDLPFNLGEVDGFQQLEWTTKCDLAEFAVDHDLNRESTQEVLDAHLALRDSATEAGDCDV